MASYEEYAEKYLKQEGNEGIEGEIKEAEGQQQARQEDATPDNVDWESRYKELEKLNSRQAQDLGNYRKLVDDYIANPTPAQDATVEEEPQPISVDDLYDDPNAAIQKAVESHPAIKEAREIKAKLEAEAQAKEFTAFQERHSDFQDIVQDPSFKNWVFENQTRLALAQTADQGDLTAADALFSLYKAEKGLSQAQTRQSQDEAIAQASLEDGHSAMQMADQGYSRSEMLEQKIRAKQGDQAAQRYVNAHATRYREALASGNVRD